MNMKNENQVNPALFLEKCEICFFHLQCSELNISEFFLFELVTFENSRMWVI